MWLLLKSYLLAIVITLTFFGICLAAVTFKFVALLFVSVVVGLIVWLVAMMIYDDLVRRQIAKETIHKYEKETVRKEKQND